MCEGPLFLPSSTRRHNAVTKKQGCGPLLPQPKRATPPGHSRAGRLVPGGGVENNQVEAQGSAPPEGQEVAWASQAFGTHFSRSLLESPRSGSWLGRGHKGGEGGNGAPPKQLSWPGLPRPVASRLGLSAWAWPGTFTLGVVGKEPSWFWAAPSQEEPGSLSGSILILRHKLLCLQKVTP